MLLRHATQFAHCSDGGADAGEFEGGHGVTWFRSGILRLMEQGLFWAGVGLAAAVATAFATFMSLVFSMWWRAIDRHAAEWAFIDGKSQWREPDRYGHGAEPSLDCVVANVGAGTAFRVQVQGVGCHVYPHAPGRATDSGWRWGKELTLLPVLAPGESFELRVYCEPTLWAEAEVAITWREQGTWRRERRRLLHREPLREVAPRPALALDERDELGTAITVPAPEEPPPPVLPERYSQQLQLPTGGRVQRWRSWRRLRTRS